MTMCNYIYTADYSKRPRSMGKRCPYPELYEKASSTALGKPEDVSFPTLPVDDHGACIFHSKEATWKRENDFEGHFLKLVQLLDAVDTQNFYDFAEFRFVGSELTKKLSSKQYVYHITNMTFRKQAYFTGALFLDSLKMEKVNFENGASFGKPRKRSSISLLAKWLKQNKRQSQRIR